MPDEGKVTKGLRQAVVTRYLGIDRNRLFRFAIFAQQIGLNHLRHSAISGLVGLGERRQFGARLFFLTGTQFVHRIDKGFALQVGCGLLLVVIDDPATKGEKASHNRGQQPTAITRPETRQVASPDGIVHFAQERLVAAAPVFARCLFSRCQSQKGLRIGLVIIGRCRP